MAVKKSELYASLKKGCDELRGGMDPSQYKDYVLSMLFVKYVSDKYAGKKGAVIVVPSGAGFADILALRGKKNIGDEINKVLSKLAEANDLQGVIDAADFNDSDKLGSGQEMVDRLTNLVAIFDNPLLNFAKNKASGDDILGDAYEYLMQQFAKDSGKSKGQFYTPSEVSRVLAKVVGVSKAKRPDQTAYDPTCGSASLLMKAADEAPVKISLYGQEKDIATTALAKMNMILHGYPTAEIAKGGSSTLSAPAFKDKKTGRLMTFDWVVANPPFSLKAWNQGMNPHNDPYDRFSYGVPPDKNGDYAFLLHILSSMKSTGKGAVVLPHGVLFRGNAEGVIRQNIIKKEYIKGIIGLPTNLFYGTGIPACVIVLDKEGAATRKGIFMVEASQGFIQDGNKNRLREQDIHRIVNTFNNQLEIEKYSRMVPIKEIEANEYNLNIPRYVDSSPPEDVHDLMAHLYGGIPNRDIDALQKYWNVMPGLRDQLFKPQARKGYSELKVSVETVKDTISKHSEKAIRDKARQAFTRWRQTNYPLMESLDVGGNPKELIANLGESLLATFQKVSGVDGYEIYQHLRSLWAAQMQDDAYLIVQDGWKAVINGQPNLDLLPPEIIKSKYFVQEKADIFLAEADLSMLSGRIEEMVSEHAVDDGLLGESRGDKDKITKASAKGRLRELKGDKDSSEEREMIEAYLDLVDQENAASKKVKGLQEARDAAAMAKYNKLSEQEVKNIVIELQWMDILGQKIEASVKGEVNNLTGRIQSLSERYGMSLENINKRVALSSQEVSSLLSKLGMEIGNG